MKVMIVANISANGKVLLSDNPYHQLPQEAMDFYLKLARKVGNLIIGAKTFDNFRRFPANVKALFDGIEIVVLSSEPIYTDFAVMGSPEEALAYLAKKGYKDIAVGGGTGVFNAFLNTDLVTDIFFNVSPLITGDGGDLGTLQGLNTNFKFMSSDVNANYAQLHLAKSNRT